MNRKLIALTLCLLLASLIMCKKNGESNSAVKDQLGPYSGWSFEPLAQTDTFRVEISEGTFNIYQPERGGTLNTLSIFDRKSNELIANAILLGDYGKHSFFYKQKIELPRLDENSHLILLQSMFGGDGDHTVNVLIAYSLINNRLELLGTQNIYNSTLTENNGIFNSLEGKAVLSFCSVCDGWDAAEPDDVFFVPISITIKEGLISTRSTLNEHEKVKMTQEFETKRQAIAQMESKYFSYKDFTDRLSQEFYSLIGLPVNESVIIQSTSAPADFDLSTPESTLEAYTSARRNGDRQLVLRCYKTDSFNLPGPIPIESFRIIRKTVYTKEMAEKYEPVPKAQEGDVQMDVIEEIKGKGFVFTYLLRQYEDGWYIIAHSAWGLDT